MNLIYLQCDVRYNQWLLKKINGRCVVEHTIDRCKKLGDEACNIIAGIYDCPENKKLIEILMQNGVDVRVTNEENVTVRFLNILIGETGKYVIRVGGDQCLIDFNRTNDILHEMEIGAKDWYYEQYSSCILPDIVRLDCLKEYEVVLKNENRYFEGLEKVEETKRYTPPYPILIMFNFRANSNERLRICKHVIENQLNIYDLSKKVLPDLICSPYLTETGLLGSWIIPSEVENFFYDEKREINPWWGKSVVDFVKKHLDKSFRVFEWGCGNSTLFWSQNVREVVSVEHNKSWFEKMLSMIPDNVRLEYCELEYGGEYCQIILNEKEKFDIILVDGRDRVRCMINAVKLLKDDGILILDNSDRAEYQEGDVYLNQCSFKKFEISSIIYGLPGAEDFTAVYYRKNNSWNI